MYRSDVRGRKSRRAGAERATSRRDACRQPIERSWIAGEKDTYRPSQPFWCLISAETATPELHHAESPHRSPRRVCSCLRDPHRHKYASSTSRHSRRAGTARPGPSSPDRHRCHQGSSRGRHERGRGRARACHRPGGAASVGADRRRRRVQLHQPAGRSGHDLGGEAHVSFDTLSNTRPHHSSEQPAAVAGERPGARERDHPHLSRRRHHGPRARCERRLARQCTGQRDSRPFVWPSGPPVGSIGVVNRRPWRISDWEAGGRRIHRSGDGPPRTDVRGHDARRHAGASVATAFADLLSGRDDDRAGATDHARARADRDRYRRDPVGSTARCHYR